MNLGARLALAIILAGGCMLAAIEGAQAAKGSNALAQAGAANGAIAQCDKSKEGQALIDCIGGALSTMAANVNRGEVLTKAPQLIALARQAAQIRGKAQAEALRLLASAISTARDVKSKIPADFHPAANAFAGVFARAVSAIEKKAAVEKK